MKIQKFYAIHKLGEREYERAKERERRRERTVCLRLEFVSEGFQEGSGGGEFIVIGVMRIFSAAGTC